MNLQYQITQLLITEMYRNGKQVTVELDTLVARQLEQMEEEGIVRLVFREANNATYKVIKDRRAVLR